jgi:hypothetical protein
MKDVFNGKKLEIALASFKEYSKESRYQEDTADRQERKYFFKKISNEKFSEFKFSEMLKKLWASQIWGNKEYLVNKIVKDNGLEILKKKFNLVCPNPPSILKLYQELLEIKGMGPSMITELLCYIDPKNAGIWNEKARKALEWLEVKGVPIEKYIISGEEYAHFNSVLQILAGKLEEEGYRGVDLLLVDYFLWEICSKFGGKEVEVKKDDGHKTKTLSRHDELRDKIAEIGSWLGFETETEKTVAIVTLPPKTGPLAIRI